MSCDYDEEGGFLGGYGTKAGAAKNKWNAFVRAYAQTKGIKYGHALKHPRHREILRRLYHQKEYGRAPPPVKPRKKPVRKYLEVGWPSMNAAQKAAQRAQWNAQVGPIKRKSKGKGSRKPKAVKFEEPEFRYGRPGEAKYAPLPVVPVQMDEAEDFPVHIAKQEDVEPEDFSASQSNALVPGPEFADEEAPLLESHAGDAERAAIPGFEVAVEPDEGPVEIHVERKGKKRKAESRVPEAVAEFQLPDEKSLRKFVPVLERKSKKQREKDVEWGQFYASLPADAKKFLSDRMRSMSPSELADNQARLLKVFRENGPMPLADLLAAADATRGSGLSGGWLDGGDIDDFDVGPARELPYYQSESSSSSRPKKKAKRGGNLYQKWRDADE